MDITKTFIPERSGNKTGAVLYKTSIFQTEILLHLLRSHNLSFQECPIFLKEIKL